jgi:hypothetical protein
MANTILLAVIALYKAPHFVGYDVNENQISLNADRIGAFTPRPAWIKRYLVPGQNQIQYLLTFEPTSAEVADPNTLTGVYVEQDGLGVVVDCISVANLVAALNGTGSYTQQYTTGVPAFTSPTTTAYCLVRADDGSGYAHNKVESDYVLQYYGNIIRRSYFSGISHYTLNSFTVPVPQTPQPPTGSGVTDIITVGACSS